MPLKQRARDTAAKVFSALGVQPDKKRSAAASDIIERALIETVLSERERFEKAALDVCVEDRDKAHKLAEAARHDREALIANLSAMR